MCCAEMKSGPTIQGMDLKRQDRIVGAVLPPKGHVDGPQFFLLVVDKRKLTVQLAAGRQQGRGRKSGHVCLSKVRMHSNGHRSRTQVEPPDAHRYPAAVVIGEGHFTASATVLRAPSATCLTNAAADTQAQAFALSRGPSTVVPQSLAAGVRL